MGGIQLPPPRGTRVSHSDLPAPDHWFGINPATFLEELSNCFSDQRRCCARWGPSSFRQRVRLGSAILILAAEPEFWERRRLAGMIATTNCIDFRYADDRSFAE